MESNIKFKQKYFILIAAIAIMILLIVLFVSIFSPGSFPVNNESVTVEIVNGMNSYRIADRFYDAGVLRYKKTFINLVKITGKARSLQAGVYRIENRISPWNLIKILSEGRVVLEKVTIPEGTLSKDIVKIMHIRLGVDSLELVNIIFNKVYCDTFKIDASTLEGYLYPDTYHFTVNTPPFKIIETMVNRFKTVLRDSLNYDGNNFDMSLHEIITLASIIEGEVVLDSERSIVSAIYHNRLGIRMYLESCPTIQYIIPDGPRRILDRDLNIDSPYNTYRNFGLPPGPVNNPGLKSIYAALNPADTNVRFLVAKGDGSHTFSANLKNHLKAKRKFDKIRNQNHWK